MGFFLPQIAQMDTDLYSLNTNRTNCTNICIIREIRELQIGGRRESQIRVEINNPQNSDEIQTEDNPCLSVESVGYLFGGKDIKTTETAVLTCSDRFYKSIFYFNFISIKIMPKSSFMAVNRQFGAFLRSELERQGMTFSMLRKRCHFDNNALSNIKKD